MRFALIATMGAGALAVVPAVAAGAAGNNSSVSGQVWFDANSDGIRQASETSGVPDVTVELVNSSSSVVATKTSNVDGDFSFTFEPAGTYTLHFVALSGYKFSPAAQGGNPATYSWPNPTTGVTPAFTLAASGTGESATVNAGIDQRPASTTAAFSGSVQTGGTTYVTFPVNVAATGEMDAELTWSGTATLSLLLINPSGATIDSSTNQSSGSSSLVGTATVTGTYKVAVKDISGGSAFSLTVHYPQGKTVSTAATYEATIGYKGTAGIYPYGMAYDPVDKSIVVGDVWNYRVQRFTTAGDYLGVASKNAPRGALGGIGSPFGLAVDSKGDTWVADQSNARVVEFNQSDQWVQTIGLGGGPNAGESDQLGCGGGKLNRPTDIAIDPTSGDLFVTDTICSTIHVYTPTGTWLYDITINLSSIGVTHSIPRGIGIGPDGNLYVAEFNSKRIIVLSEKGQLLGTYPATSGLQDPRGLAIDPVHGLIYVVDGGDNGGRVYQYTLPAAGKYSGTLTGELQTSSAHPFQSVRFITVDPAGDIYVSDCYGYQVFKFDYQLNQLTWDQAPEPPPNGGFNKLNGIGINPATGIVYAMDTFGNREQALATTVNADGDPVADGTPESCTSASSCPNFQFAYESREFPNANEPGLNYPRALTFAGGDVWADAGRVVKEYTAAGVFIRGWGGQGTAPGEFSENIFGIYVVPNANNTDGLVYVVDSGNCRLQVFNEEGVLQEYMGSCGTGTNQMNHPGQVVVAGNLAYVDDSDNNRVDVWNLTTKSIVSTIDPTFGTVKLSNPTGVALSPDGTQLYISDYDHYRIVRYALNGSSDVVMTTGADTPAGKLTGPNYLVFGPDGRLYVSDDSEHIYSFNINS